MIAAARHAVPTCMLTVVPLGMAGLSVVGLSMWPATMIGRLGRRAARTSAGERVVAGALRTTGALVVSSRTRWAAVIGRLARAALRDTGQAPPFITIGPVALRAQRGTAPLPCVMTGRVA